MIVRRLNILIVIIICFSVFVPFQAHAQLNWIFMYDTSGTYGEGACAIRYANNGFLYTLGSGNDGYGRNIIALGVTHDGYLDWEYRYTEPLGGINVAYSMHYDNDHKIYIAGGSGSSINHRAYTIISLNDDGVENWVFKHADAVGLTSSAYAVCTDFDGNVYTAGILDTSGVDDFAVISLDTTGSINWMYLGEGGGGAYSISYVQDGNIYACGGRDGCAAIVSLSTTGDSLWTYSHDSPGCLFDLVGGTDGNIYAAGYFELYGGGYDYRDILVLSLDSSGDTNWSYAYDGGFFECDQAKAVLYDSTGIIYALGTTTTDYDGFTDIILIALDTLGDQKWIHTYDGTAYDWHDDYAGDFVLGADHRIYLTGSSRGTGGNLDIVTICVDSTGTRQWVYRYNGLGCDDDRGLDIAIGDCDLIYTAGISNEGEIRHDDVIVISMGYNGGSNEYYGQTIIPCGSDLRISPNPFTVSTRISLGYESMIECVSVNIYDVTGRLVTKLIDFMVLQDGSVDVVWDGKDSADRFVPSGIYFVQVNTNPACDEKVKKLVLFR